MKFKKLKRTNKFWLLNL